MHLRRALLLFAIVLGLAAIAASLSRPRDQDSEPVSGSPRATESGPTASPGPDSTAPRVELTFAANDAGAQRLLAGQAATVLVEVDESGQVEIADLGLSAAAEPLTPARFEVLPSTPGRYPISFTPAGAADSREVATLVVRVAAQ